ncbi:MAG: radical SAM protein, partial [Planctomycetota bacterium]|nr:radical SAM protein [Planctomycetota bacterium]
MPVEESVDWALRSLEFAFDCGIRVATVIPTRAGNGAVDALERVGEYTPPRLSQLEAVLEQAISWNRGRVFVDLWDAERFRDCSACGAEQIRRLDEMNRRQTVLPKIGTCPRPGCRRNSA